MHAMVRFLLAVAALAATPSTADKAPRVIPGTYFVELHKGAVRPTTREKLSGQMTNKKS